jgi:hypothetical protein
MIESKIKIILKQVCENANKRASKKTEVEREKGREGENMRERENRKRKKGNTKNYKETE